MISKDEINAVYKDMVARLEMGLLTDPETGDVEADSFCENLREAIAEKMPSETPDIGKRQLDFFSVTFGAVSERLLRDLYTAQGKRWW